MSGIPDYLVSWEAEYFDGTDLRERDGAKYGQIDRAHLKIFRLVSGGEMLVEAPIVNGRTGWNLCYRRRTTMSARQGEGFQRHTWFLVGFVPMGPVLALDSANMVLRTASTFSPDGDPLFYPPTPRTNEGEHFVGAVEHRLSPTSITLR